MISCHGLARNDAIFNFKIEKRTSVHPAQTVPKKLAAMFPCYGLNTIEVARIDEVGRIDDADPGQSAIEEILRSGNCPVAAEFLALSRGNRSIEP